MTPSPGWKRSEEFPNHQKINSPRGYQHRHDQTTSMMGNANVGPSSRSVQQQFTQPHHLYSNFESGESLRASGLPTAPRPNSISPSSMPKGFHHPTIINNNNHSGGYEYNNSPIPNEPHFRSNRIKSGAEIGEINQQQPQQQQHSFPTSAPRMQTINRSSFSHHPSTTGTATINNQSPFSPPRPSSAIASLDHSHHHHRQPSSNTINRDRSFSDQIQHQQRKVSSSRRYDEDFMMKGENGRMGGEEEGEEGMGNTSYSSYEMSRQNGSNSNKSSDTITARSKKSLTSPTTSTSNKKGDSSDLSTTTTTATHGGETATRESAGRKQNSACDACRNRKVRCHRTPGEEKCNHCKSKGIECTTIYVQLATQGIKRPIKRHRGEGITENDPSPTMGIDVPTVVRYLLLRDGEYGDVVQGLSYSDLPGKRVPPTTAAETRLINATARQEFVSSLLDTYFATVHIRYPVIDPQEFLQRFHYQTSELGGPPPDVLTAVLLAWGAKFSTHPIIVADRRETANEELTPSQRLRRSVNNPLASRALNSSHGSESSSSRTGTGGSGGKGEGLSSSSNEQQQTRDVSKVMGRSRIAEDLIIKAQEVLDRNKAHRIATMDNVKAAIIVQALFWQQASQRDPPEATTVSQLQSFKRKGVYICNGSWINSAIAHMYEMRFHLQGTVDKIVDEVERNQVAMCWFLASMFDSHMSAYYRRKPMIQAEDFSTQPPIPAKPGPVVGPSPIAAQEGFRIWLNSAIDANEMLQSVYYTLWTPCAYEEGVSARKLERLVSSAYRWRSNHLALVGAPEHDWPSEWKFADAVTACSSDLNYSMIWILMWQAIEEYGIAELRATNVRQYNATCLRHGTASPSDHPIPKAEMELEQTKVNGMRNAIYDEALRASLRSAELAKMLTDFKYLQNDSGIMKYALCEAGFCLTQFQRPEVYKIIQGLRQYGQAFEECYEQADELERLAMEYCAPPGSGPNSMTMGMGKHVGGGQRQIYSSEGIPNEGPNGGGIFGFSAGGPSPHHSSSTIVDGTMLYSNVPSSSRQQNQYQNERKSGSNNNQYGHYQSHGI